MERASSYEVVQWYGGNGEKRGGGGPGTKLFDSGRGWWRRPGGTGVVCVGYGCVCGDG